MPCQEILSQQCLSYPLGVFSPSPHVKPLLRAQAAQLVALSPGHYIHWLPICMRTQEPLHPLWSGQSPVVGVVPDKADSGYRWEKGGLTLEEHADPLECDEGGVGVCCRG